MSPDIVFLVYSSVYPLIVLGVYLASRATVSLVVVAIVEIVAYTSESV